MSSLPSNMTSQGLSPSSNVTLQMSPDLENSQSLSTAPDAMADLKACLRSGIVLQSSEKITLPKESLGVLAKIITQRSIFDDLSKIAKPLWHRRIKGLDSLVAEETLERLARRETEGVTNNRDVAEKIIAKLDDKLPDCVAELDKYLVDEYLVTEVMVAGRLLGFTRLPCHLIESVLQTWVHYRLCTQSSASSPSSMTTSREYEAGRICLLYVLSDALDSVQCAFSNVHRMGMCLEKLMTRDMEELDVSLPLDKE